MAIHQKAPTLFVPKVALYDSKIQNLLSSSGSELRKKTRNGQFLNDLIRSSHPDRMIISSDCIFGTDRFLVKNDVLYPKMVRRLKRLFLAFQETEVELFFSVLDPLSLYIAATYRQNRPNIDIEAIRKNYTDINWYEFVSRIRNRFPDLPITIWRQEDLPFVWHSVVQMMAGNQTQVLSLERATIDDVVSDPKIWPNDNYSLLKSSEDQVLREERLMKVQFSAPDIYTSYMKFQAELSDISRISKICLIQ